MPEQRSIEARLLFVLGGIALVAMLGVLAMLPYRLYSRDIRYATVQAHRLSNFVHASISHAVVEGEDVAPLINRLQGVGELEIYLRPLEPGEQHPAAHSRKGTSTLDGTDLTYVAAPILDGEGQSWLAEMRFDLSPMKRESIRLIIDLMLAVAVGSALFSAVVYWLVHAQLVVPLRKATRVIEKHDPKTEVVTMPRFASQEMTRLANAVETACRGHHGVS